MKKLLLIKTIFCLLVFASCKSAVNNEEFIHPSLDGVSDTDLVTPYADMSLLENTRSATTSDPDIVNWKVARFFAVVEKIEFEDHYEAWKGAKVSEKPIVIYYTNSEKPKYYEFRVIKDNVEVGSITCNASKKEGKPIVYVSEMSHKVLGKVAKELATRSGNARLSMANYPNQFVVEKNSGSARSVEGVQGEFKDALTCEVLDASKLFIEERADVMLEKADAKMLKQLEITEEQRLEILKEMKEQEEIDSEMWQDIDSVENEMIAMSDEEIERRVYQGNAQVANQSDIGIRHVEWTEERSIYRNFLDDWYNKREWEFSNKGTGSWGACGPYACTFITMGLGEKSGYKNVPLSSKEHDKMAAMYDAFENTIGTGPKLISSLDYGMVYHTKYRIERVCSHSWTDVDEHFRSYKLPVISLRSGWYGNDAGYHYRTIIGVATYRTTKHHVIWWYWFGWRNKRWTRSYDTNWYYMHDSGVDSKGWYNHYVDGDKRFGNFWERSGLPCQRRLGLVKGK